MPALAPLKFALYDLDTYETRGKYICNFVPLRFLKLAIRLSKSPVNINADTLAGLIVDLFGNKFSVDDLLKYSEEIDRMILLQEIMLRAGSFLSKASEAVTADGENVSSEFNLEDEDWIIDLEVSLVKAFNWNLKDIDEMYIETLLPFVSHFAGTNVEPNVKRKVYCDEISWL